MSGAMRVRSLEPASGPEPVSGGGSGPTRAPARLFEGFQGVWTPVIASHALGAERPFGTEIAGTKVVLFRGEGGRVSALLDRCPHRGVALSLGKVKKGCLECPFHGWQLDGEGHVRHVPWNPDAKLERLRGDAIPAREHGGLVWVYTSERAAEGEPYVPPALLDPSVRVTAESVVWKTHWTRAMENMLDWPHLPFVHAGTIGRGMLRASDARMDVHWEATPWGATSRIEIDGEAQKARLDFRWPNGMTLYIPITKRVFVLQVACIPIDARTTRLLLITGRDFLRAPWLDGFFHWQNRRIAVEDQAVVESSDPPEVPHAGDEASVRTDSLPLHFRKRYYAELRDGGRRRPLPVVASAGS